MPENTEDLAAELFEVAQYDQGKAYISDGLGQLPAEELYRIARQTITINRRLNKKLREWLRQHGQPTKEDKKR